MRNRTYGRPHALQNVSPFRVATGSAAAVIFSGGGGGRRLENRRHVIPPPSPSRREIFRIFANVIGAESGGAFERPARFSFIAVTPSSSPSPLRLVKVLKERRAPHERDRARSGLVVVVASSSEAANTRGAQPRLCFTGTSPASPLEERLGASSEISTASTTARAAADCLLIRASRSSPGPSISVPSSSLASRVAARAVW
eukprot:30700-Pelagococcus_subviridis.AAC.2